MKTHLFNTAFNAALQIVSDDDDDDADDADADDDVMMMNSCTNISFVSHRLTNYCTVSLVVVITKSFTTTKRINSPP